MTITLSQVKQITGVTAFSNFSVVYTNRAVIFNPSLPAFVFDYIVGSFSSIQVGLVVGSTQQQLYSSASGGSNQTANEVPVLFFSQYILAGGGVCGYSGCMQNGLDECGPWFISYNLANNTYTQNCSAEPSNSLTTHLLDVIVDYANQYVYLYHSSSTRGAGVLFAIPFSALSSFLANLQPPSSYKVAWIYPANNVPSGWAIYPGNVVYYNSTFYIVGFDSSGNYYIWVVPYSSINWTTNGFPSSTQSVGTVYQIYNGGGAGAGNIFLNYYVSSGSIVTEILAYVPAGWNSSNITYNNVYIYSFNPSNNTATQLYSLSNANAFMRSINMGGIIIFVQKPQSGTFYISAYDRKTNSYEQSQAISGVLGVLTAEPYYAIVFSGTASSMTITIYQILLDVTPAFVNVSYQNGTLSGQVVNLNGNKALANVTVYLFSLATQGDDYSSGSQVSSTTTDSNGNFSFNISQAGSYVLKVIQS